jgi:hypothetical protein
VPPWPDPNTRGGGGLRGVMGSGREIVNRVACGRQRGAPGQWRPFMEVQTFARTLAWTGSLHERTGLVENAEILVHGQGQWN